jgi:imidazolonepropionase
VTAEATGLRVWKNARLATLAPSLPELGVIERGAVATRDSRIAFAGPEAELPSNLRKAHDITDCEGRWITPGLIDCHTHLVHAGNRAREFELRLQGATYEEVARAGGGIVSSVKALRAASLKGLVEQSLPRIDALIAEGVTTIGKTSASLCWRRAAWASCVRLRSRPLSLGRTHFRLRRMATKMLSLLPLLVRCCRNWHPKA